MCAGSCRRRAFRLWLVAILSSSAFGGWDRRNGPRVRGHIADCGWRRRRKAGTGTSLGKCPQFPCPRFKFRGCWLTVMAIHDRPRFKPMPNNAWPRSLRLRTFAVVGGRRARLCDGEHGGQTAGEGQRGNGSWRQSNHCPIPSKRDRHADPGRSRTTLRRSAAFGGRRRLMRLASQITSSSVLFRELQTGPRAGRIYSVTPANEHPHRRRARLGE
jgi:hypothetical protein